MLGVIVLPIGDGLFVGDVRGFRTMLGLILAELVTLVHHGLGSLR